jgi:four helix bundle protein
MKVMKYTELLAWQRAMDLAVAVYQLTAFFPTEERYGPSRQARESAVSIPSNIAEGQGRKSRKEFQHYLSIAVGSLQELETQLLLASRLGWVKASAIAEVQEILAEVGRLTNGLFNSLTPEGGSGRSVTTSSGTSSH